MVQTATITTLHGKGGSVLSREQVPQLVVIGICDDLSAPSSRHVLSEIDEVRFGRGERRATR